MGNLTGSGTSAKEEDRFSQWVWLLIGIGTAGRLLLAAFMGLGVDETYVAAVSRSWSLSYFDHPPLHLWLIHLTSLVFQSENPLLLRFPFILAFAGSTWLMYQLTRLLFSAQAGFFACLLLNVSPVFSLSTGSWMLPDGPLMCSMLAAVYCLSRIFFDSSLKRVGLWWGWAGGFTGLAMLSKYHGIFVAAGTFLFLVTNARCRCWLRTFFPYGAVLAAGIIASPIVIWNGQHGWISFLFQGGRAVSRGFYPIKLLQNILGQALWLLPWIWGPLVWAGIRAIVIRNENDLMQERRWFLCCLAMGPIVLFTVATVWGSQGLFHWQAPGYLFLFPLLGEWTARGLQRARWPEAYRGWLAASVVIFVLLIGILGSHTATGWMKQVVPDWFRGGDPSLEALAWNDLPEQLAEQGWWPQNTDLIIAPHWIDAAKIDYSLGGKKPVICLNREPHHFSFMHDMGTYAGKTALMIGRKTIMEENLSSYGSCFSHMEFLGTIWIKRHGVPEVELSVWRGWNFSGEYMLPYGLHIPQ